MSLPKKNLNPTKKQKPQKPVKCMCICRKANLLSWNKGKLNDIVNHLYFEYVKTFDLTVALTGTLSLV